MLEGEIFVRKFTAVDAHDTGSIVIDEVSTLDHEIFYHSMEGGPFESDGH